MRFQDGETTSSAANSNGVGRFEISYLWNNVDYLANNNVIERCVVTK